jgi:hypothetical protein
VTALHWFGAYKKIDWKVGEAREAHADNRGGRYRIQRDAEAFIVRYCEPYLAPDVLWKEIGTALTELEAVRLAQIHNDRQS